MSVKLLKYYRKAANLTLRDAANKLRLKIGELSDIEHGRRLPTFEVLEKMETIYKAKLVGVVRFADDSCLECPHCGKTIAID